MLNQLNGKNQFIKELIDVKTGITLWKQGHPTWNDTSMVSMTYPITVMPTGNPSVTPYASGVSEDSTRTSIAFADNKVYVSINGFAVICYNSKGILWEINAEGGTSAGEYDIISYQDNIFIIYHESSSSLHVRKYTLDGVLLWSTQSFSGTNSSAIKLYKDKLVISLGGVKNNLPSLYILSTDNGQVISNGGIGIVGKGMTVSETGVIFVLNSDISTISAVKIDDSFNLSSAINHSTIIYVNHYSRYIECNPEGTKVWTGINSTSFSPAARSAYLHQYAFNGNSFATTWSLAMTTMENYGYWLKAANTAQQLNISDFRGIVFDIRNNCLLAQSLSGRVYQVEDNGLSNVKYIGNGSPENMIICGDKLLLGGRQSVGMITDSKLEVSK